MTRTNKQAKRGRNTAAAIQPRKIGANDRVRVGIVGCGAISEAYTHHIPQFKVLELAGCADLLPERAKALAAKANIPAAYESVEALLADPNIDIVVNLTIPKAHYPVAMAAIKAGKHVYNEKPLAVTREQGGKLLAAANKARVRVGGAPDTFLGAGIQTSRKLLDDGAIGRPVGVTAFMLCPGHESWHPDPAFYYKPGGGPMFDMGPYYLTALTFLLGGIKRLSGAASIAIGERTVGSGAKMGEKISVETPDHIVGTLEFRSGVVGSIFTSFATRFGEEWPITIYGTEGTLRVPDPNGFDGNVFLRRIGDDQWKQMPHTHRVGHGRGAGVADMAHALRSGRAVRAGALQTFAVLDAMQGFLESAKTGKAHVPAMRYEQPRPLPMQLEDGWLDD